MSHTMRLPGERNRSLGGPLRAARIVLVTAWMLAVVGCGSGSAVSQSSPVATSTVDLPKSYRFEPATITVSAGTTVTWTNNDNFSHNVHFLDPGLPSAPLVMKPGENQAFTFPSPGTFRYECSFHPSNMKGTVVVSG